MTPPILEKSILATIFYYDCFDWPLTTFEIWTRLVRPLEKRKTQNAKRKTTVQNLKFSLYEVTTQLENSDFLRKYTAQRNGFWFLKGRKELVAKRIDAMKESEEKLKRLFRYRWIFLGTAFLEGAFVSGSVAGGWAKEPSDIDILVVAKKGRIWTTRLFLTLWTTMLRIRRKDKRIANQICLNHYITGDSLLIPFQSLYNAQTYIHLIPLVNRKRIFEKFFQKNGWIKKYFCSSFAIGKSEEYLYKFPARPSLEGWMRIDRGVDELVLSGFWGDIFERIARRIQLYFIAKNPLTGKPGGRIHTGDFQLEFHPESKEQTILACYNKKLHQFGLREFYPEKDSGLV